jgi:predicted nucleic acid-binding protein
MKIFIDTNVLLDVLLNRKDVAEESSCIWALCEKDTVKGYISAISFNNAHYVICKVHSRKKADQAMRTMLDSFNVVPLDDKILNRATDADFNDFEDSIQFFSALHCDADYIISRNIKDFPKEDIPVLEPKDFLALDVKFS